jgi:ATP/maltotriose-dependent transcriptional regulator MalT
MGYEEAAVLARSILAEMREYGLAFPLPHVEWTLAAAELGLRHFSRSEALLRRVEQREQEHRDVYLELNIAALRARLHLAQQRPREALDLTARDYSHYPIRSMYGEYLATRALALALLGKRRAAMTTAKQAVALTHNVETAVLSAAVKAVGEAQEPSGSDAAIDELIGVAIRVNAWDGVVCAVRAFPRLLSRILERPGGVREMRLLLLRSNDVALAKATGVVTRETGTRGLLSPREVEILDHARQGKRNAEIAASLFISPGTVKSHMDHIFGKLGVRSRTSAVARYAEIERAVAGESEATPDA